MSLLKSLRKGIVAGGVALASLFATSAEADNFKYGSYKLELDIDLNKDYGLEHKIKDLTLPDIPSFNLPRIEVALPLPFELVSESVAPFLAKRFLDEIDIYKDTPDLGFEYKNLLLAVPTQIIGSYLFKSVWHELAHMRTAYYFGCEDIKFHGPSKRKKIMFAVSYKSPEGGLDTFDENNITLSGVDSTTMAGHLLYEALKHDDIPNFLRPITASTAMFMSLERHGYIWLTALLNYARTNIHPGNDIHQVMFRTFHDPYFDGFLITEDKVISGVPAYKGDIWHFKKDDDGIIMRDENGYYIPQKFVPYADKDGNFRKYLEPHRYKNTGLKQPGLQKKLDVAYGIALGLSALEIGLRWKEFDYLFWTALGKDKKAPEGFEVFRAGMYPLPNGFLISIDGIW